MIYQISSACYTPRPAVGNDNDYPDVFIRAQVIGDIVTNGQPGFGYVSNYFTWKSIEIPYASMGAAGVQASLAAKLFVCAFGVGPWFNNEGVEIFPPEQPDYFAADFIQPAAPNGQPNQSVVCAEAMVPDWSQ